MKHKYLVLPLMAFLIGNADLDALSNLYKPKKNKTVTVPAELHIAPVMKDLAAIISSYDDSYDVNTRHSIDT